MTTSKSKLTGWMLSILLTAFLIGASATGKFTECDVDRTRIASPRGIFDGDWKFTRSARLTGILSTFDTPASAVNEADIRC